MDIKQDSAPSGADMLRTKLGIMRSYAGITVRLCVEPFEEMDALFDIRAGLIKDYNDVEKALEQAGGMVTEEALAAAKREQVEIAAGIARDEVKLAARMDGFKEELAAEYAQLQKSKQVLDFMDSATANVRFNGNTLDERT